MLQNGGAETEVQLGVALCNFMQVHCCLQQSPARLRQCHKISHYNLGQACYSQAQTEFAWYLCCVSVVCTIVFTNSHSAGRAK